MKQTLALIEPAALAGKFDRQRYAMLFDRVAEMEERPQRYGSQDMCVGGQRFPYTLEDASIVDQLRADMGMDTMEEYWARMREMYGISC